MVASEKAGIADGFVRLAFVVTICLSAFLLFLIQPLFSKMVLPLLGGAPVVWNTAMLFFQSVFTSWLFIRAFSGESILPSMASFNTCCARCGCVSVSAFRYRRMVSSSEGRIRTIPIAWPFPCVYRHTLFCGFCERPIASKLVLANVASKCSKSLFFVFSQQFRICIGVAILSDSF